MQQRTRAMEDGKIGASSLLNTVEVECSIC
jgi:hypothetical protein